MQTLLLIDGENLKGKIKAVFKAAGLPKPVWHQYDFDALFTEVLQGISVDRRIFYFGRIKEHPQSKEKSKELIEEQRLLKSHLEHQGFLVVLAGRVRGQMEDVRGKQLLVFKEKGVDVKIAVDMVSQSCDGSLKEVILASSDSDLQPALEEIRKRKTQSMYLGFENQPNKGLSYTTNKTILFRNSEVIKYQNIQLPLLAND